MLAFFFFTWPRFSGRSLSLVFILGEQKSNLYKGKSDKCRLYTEVQVSMLFTQQRAEGPRLCKSHRDRTKVYNGLVPWAITTDPHLSNDSAGYKSQLEWHPATVRIVCREKAG